jgi:hypothetical protein
MTTTDTIAAAVLACFFSFFLAFALGRTFREIVPDDRTRRTWWFIGILAITGSAAGWSVFRVMLRILVNAMGGPT